MGLVPGADRVVRHICFRCIPEDRIKFLSGMFQERNCNVSSWNSGQRGGQMKGGINAFKSFEISTVAEQVTDIFIFHRS